MPLEVNEIGIRLQVRDREDGEDQSEENRRPNHEEKDGCCGIDRDEIVEECMRRVLRMLKEARER
jgi:hypothetical protein